MSEAPERWLDDTEQATWRAYLEGSTRLAEALSRQLETQWGLTLGEYAVLVRLSEAPEGTMRMSELADALAHSRSRTTHTVRRLESRGHVRRVACPSDGRGVNCELTPAGRTALSDAAPSHVAAVRHHLIGLLSPAEAAQLSTIMERVAHAAR
ncbi:MarR family winged helix-turn-helix transcriptional regulator [Sanguibacter sp. A247]|uniref:MarR family winged helix-turn-helix transcriptional regulator n=1 Tax=unclassified Sanguibacter TaxID=2645534 RepID=UPI003FD7FC76